MNRKQHNPKRWWPKVAGALIAVTGAAGLAGCNASAKKAEIAQPQAMTDEQRSLQIESFDKVWEIVQTRHWDEKLNGVDWDAAKQELRPRVEAAETEDQARGVMRELLARLGQSHFAIIDRSSYERYDEQTSGGEGGAGWTGMEIRLVEDQMVVTQVRRGSPADEQGIIPGWAIESINGRPVSDMIEAIRGLDSIQRAETTLAMAAEARFSGEAGQTRSAVFLDAADEPVEVELVLAEAPGEIASFGELPPAPVEVRTMDLDGGVAYFGLSIFFDAPRVLREFSAFVRANREAPGLIIDVRGNPGGVILMASGMMNWLIQERGLKLGTLKMRDPRQGPYEVPIVLNPRGRTYTGKVAVLTDEASVSNSEILSGGLQGIGRARVFGARTAGLVLPAAVERLPSGDGFLYAFASYTSSDGAFLEGAGVTPDEPIELTREALLAGEDPALEAAIKWILKSEQ